MSGEHPALPKALFAGIVLVHPDRAIIEELLTLDPRYVVCSGTDDDHLRFLIKKQRIPVVTASPGTVPEPPRWLNVVPHSADDEITLKPIACTLLIRTDVLSPRAAARSIHALAMA